MHCVPHVPQSVLLVERSAHEPLQLTVPVGHVHCEFWQTRSPPQLSPQRPQFCLFELRSTHEAPHRTYPEAAQRTAQVPALQVGAVAGQELPQDPQLPLFDSRSTQLPSPLRPTAHCV
jgi:hypothetical protein